METRLTHLTSSEVGALLRAKPVVVLPVGSLEQHGPIGLCGTDTLCAEIIAAAVGAGGGFVVLPTLAYAPAQFNMGFSGTISIKAKTLMALFEDIVGSLVAHGVRGVYVLNGHGANLAPIQASTHDLYAELGEVAPRIRLKSWWDFAGVNAIRHAAFGAWEGMHATPSEISITESAVRIVDAERPDVPVSGPLSDAFIRDHAGDRHAPAARHKTEFPDGRVGSHSALANPEVGSQLLTAAVAEIGDDVEAFLQALQSN